MLDDFLVRAALAGVGLTLATGPLGAFVVWRRMAYFGDATAHAALLGVALALMTALPVAVGTLAVAAVMGLAVAALAARGETSDAALGVLSHGALAAGLVAISFAPGSLSLEAYLFGDILAVGRGDLALIWGGGAAVAAVLAWRWQRLLTATLSVELAQSAGISPRREELVLTLTLALTVALALKVVGALLIAALLVIPAAAARNVARSPEAMALLAVAAGTVSVLSGLGLSLRLDTPAGPSIAASAAGLYALSLAAPRRR
jgi:zinc transport system permease protein